MPATKSLACWICGRRGAKKERTFLGFKKPICPPGKGCSSKKR